MTGGPWTETPVREVDRAALLGAALAAVVALTFGGNGEWDWLATCAGFALLAVLTAFFRLPHGRSRGAVVEEVAALAAVVALAATLVFATPIQGVVSTYTADGAGCRAAGALAAATVLDDPARQRAAGLAAERLAAQGIDSSPRLVLADAAEEADARVRGDCIGAATSRVLWVPALLVGAAVFVAARLRVRRTSE